MLKGYDERHIPQKLFRRHLSFLKSRGYKFISLDDYARAREQGQRLDRAVILTFDDGFRNVIQNAVPAMAQDGAMGVLYVVVECARFQRLLWTDQVESWVRAQPGPHLQVSLGQSKLSYPIHSKKQREFAMGDIKRRLRALPDHERRSHLEHFSFSGKTSHEFEIASLAELKEVRPETLQIASHTMSHPNCTRIEIDGEFQTELGQSKVELERMLGLPVEHFAYPAGAYDERVVTQVRKFGYRTAVTTDPGLNNARTDLLKLKRVGTNHSFILFQAMTSGSYFFLSQRLHWRK